MDELVFARESSWFPSVIRQDGELRIHLIGGADALHDPRTFTFPIEAAHLTVIRTSLARHLLLYCALTPLANAAGNGGPLDERAAIALLDPILLSTDDEVDQFFWKTVGTNACSLPTGPTSTSSSASSLLLHCVMRRRTRTGPECTNTWDDKVLPWT